MLEYWTGKKDSQKVRTKYDGSTVCLLATVVNSEGERCDGDADSRTNAQCDSHYERQIQERHQNTQSERTGGHHFESDSITTGMQAMWKASTDRLNVVLYTCVLVTSSLSLSPSAYVDGLEWSGLSSLRLTAQWDQSPTSGVPLSLIKSFPS